MTETASKTSLKNKDLCNCGYFAIIPCCSHFTMLTKNPATGLALSKSIHRTKDFRLYAQVLIKTVNQVISRCCFVENGTDLSIRACRTCSTIIFPHSTNQILSLWRCRCRSRRWCSHSLLSDDTGGSRTEWKSCLPMSLTSLSSARDRNKCGWIWFMLQTKRSTRRSHRSSRESIEHVDQRSS